MLRLGESPRVMIVDDDPVTCDLLCEVFRKEGFDTRFEQSSAAALSALDLYEPDVVLSDIRMGSRNDGLNLLTEIRREHPATPVVLMTAFGSIDTAVLAVREGAYDYISKPFLMDEVVSTVRRALTASSSSSHSPNLEDTEEAAARVSLVGRNPAMLEIYKVIGRVADAKAPVLILGESGTGKELVARAIHSQGKRHNAPFVAINCGALTETLLESELFGHVKGSFTGAVNNKRGIFEQAEDGTVFLDEISETSPALQVKLLRVLQEKEIVPVGGVGAVSVRARVVAATNANLNKLCHVGLFRRDLFFRLNVISLSLPPLRERLDDLPLLVSHLIRKHTPEGEVPATLEEAALNRLAVYSWPGNVRELENVIERAITLKRDGPITAADLGPLVLDDERPDLAKAPVESAGIEPAHIQTLDELERDHLTKVLTITAGNKKRAAELLGINRRTLYRMIERFELETNERNQP